MDPPTLKPNLLKNILARVLSFGVLILAIRFAYFVTVKGRSCDSGDFCFKLLRSSSITAARARPSAAVYGVHVSSAEDGLRFAYSSIFRDFISNGFLSPNSKVLCVGTEAGEAVLALRDIGVLDSVGDSKNPSPSPALIVSSGDGEAHRLPYDDNTFDFEFSGIFGLDRSNRPVELASEMGRTLKPGGFLVVHTAAKDRYSLNSLLDLFRNSCTFIRSREIDSSSIREVVMKKEIKILERNSSRNGDSGDICSVPGYKREITQNAEPLIQEEPLKPWRTMKRNINSIKYLTSMVDIGFKNRYVYVDVGARSYGSSIGSWFKKQYPKQNKTFEVYAIEADMAFHEEYRGRRGVTLLPYAAWVRNETLFFEITWRIVEKGGRGMGRTRSVQSLTSYMGNVDKIQGFDLANWLKRTVSERDFVVVKMDVEGTEFHLIPRLIKTGAICLIDEIFLECHYNRWRRCCPGQRSVKYQKTYAQCLNLFTSLRESGVLVHQWW